MGFHFFHFKSFILASSSSHGLSDLQPVQNDESPSIHLHRLQVKPNEINYRNTLQETNNEKESIVVEDAKESHGNKT